MAESRDGAHSTQVEKERVVGLLGGEWATIAKLMDALGDDAWSTPVLPGWDVHDVLAHIVGGERMLAGDAAPQTPAGLEDAPHVRNPIARVNETWIAALRPLPHAELLAMFRAITGERLAALQAMSVEDFNAPSWTPAGDGTYGRFMEIRLFDAWMHEQDIRQAVGRPGNEDGPAADAAIDEVAGALGYIVGKRAGAPQGSSVKITLTGPIERELCVVVDGKAKVVPAIDGQPTAGLALGSSLFLRLAGGRVNPEGCLPEVHLSGDAALARQLATHLAYTI